MVKKPKPFLIIIRASGERTVDNLKQQLERTKKPIDVIVVLDSKVSFEKKMEEGFKEALGHKTNFTLFIDGDILVKSDFIKKIKKITFLLNPNDLGFGIRLWDRFYNCPKFRGAHIYRTNLLQKALNYIPDEGLQLRPETYVKKRMQEEGYLWRNNISNYIGGIHDFFQIPQDIYYKFLIRSKRSPEDISVLEELFRKKNYLNDFKIALKGLEDGKKKDKITNNKFTYRYPEIPNNVRRYLFKTTFEIDMIIFTKKILRYLNSIISL